MNYTLSWTVRTYRCKLFNYFLLPFTHDVINTDKIRSGSSLVESPSKTFWEFLEFASRTFLTVTGTVQRESLLKLDSFGQCTICTYKWSWAAPNDLYMECVRIRLNSPLLCNIIANSAKQAKSEIEVSIRPQIAILQTLTPSIDN